MKKLSEIKLKDFYEMDEMEMKNVVGGSGAKSCDIFVICDDGKKIEIKDCIGNCSSSSSSITCKGPTATLTKDCPGSSGSGSGNDDSGSGCSGNSGCDC